MDYVPDNLDYFNAYEAELGRQERLEARREAEERYADDHEDEYWFGEEDRR